MNRTAPLLQPAHFAGLSIKLSAGGLSGVLEISHDIREAETAGLDESDDERLARFDSLRPHTLVAINPKQHSAAAIAEKFLAASRLANEKDDVKPDYGLPSEYEQQWTILEGGHSVAEGQHIVLVAYDESEPVGHVALNACLIHPATQDESTELLIELHLVYVAPSQRGKGFGFDLSIACGLVCADLLEACYRAVPSRTSLRPTICADFITDEGDKFTRHVIGSLEYRSDMLRPEGQRQSVRIEPLQFYGGI